ncbi:hypothetical protein [Lacinutrix sp. MEBiC02404]
MNTNIYYQVETKYWRREVPNIHDALSVGVPTHSDIAETSTLYKNDSPLVARSAAFNHFNSIIDVLYEGLGKEQTSDAQARIDLQCYLDSGNAIELGGKDARFKSSPDFDKGIEIYMVIEDSSKKTVEKYLIHGIRYLDYLERFDAGIQESLEGLIKECNYFEQHRFSLDKKHIEALDLKAIGGKEVSVLQTPFDWEQLLLDYDGVDLFDKNHFF